MDNKAPDSQPRDEKQATESPGPRILYRFLKLDDSGIVTEKLESSEPIQLGETTGTESLTSETILEVLTTQRVRRYVKSELEKVLKIRSAYLVNVLRDVVAYWPGFNLPSVATTEPLEIEEPYQILAIYRDDIENYKANHPPSHSQSYIEQCNNHIDLLLGFFDRTIGDEILAERALHSKSMATFKYLWLLFRPGEIVYIRATEDEPARPFVVGDTRNVTEMWRVDQIKLRSQTREGLLLRGWFVQNDGDVFRPAVATVIIGFFTGERPISSLEVYPKRFHPDPHYEDTLQERGKRYWKHAKPTYTHYRGTLLEFRPLTYYQNEYGPSDIDITERDGGLRSTGMINERIVLDADSWHQMKENPHLYPQFSSKTGRSLAVDERGGGQLPLNWKEVPSSKGCECTSCQLDNSSVIRKSPLFDPIDVADAPKSGTSLLYILSDYVLRGFVLRENRWAMFHIDQVNRVEFKKDPFQHLILLPQIKDTITSIVWNYGKSDGVLTSWSPDFVSSKGEGQIFLLHGTPGVGKTCTAECVADYTRKPLLPISCADIGISAVDVQRNIGGYFRLAKQWGAVVLIDEADVYLEQRSPDNLERNSLVSVFLRQLEYFQGLLFITTNRVGAFDDAFISRIHVSLYYPPLTDADREKIWKTNFRRLEGESRIEVAKATRHFVEDDKDLRLVKWNGREIRNAFQTAVSLARKEADDQGSDIVILQPEHIGRVVQISMSFKRYIDAVHENDEAGRARRTEVRADDFEVNGR